MKTHLSPAVILLVTCSVLFSASCATNPEGLNGTFVYEGQVFSKAPVYKPKYADSALKAKLKDTLDLIDTDSLMWAQRKKDSTKRKLGILPHHVDYYLDMVPANDTADHSENTCTKSNCVVWADVNKSRQLLYLWLSGTLVDSFKVSTGSRGAHETPFLDIRPEGPIYKKYTSRKFPGGDYKDLGNMPYAVFINGGIAIHGTASIWRLGNKASHGCVRVHPDNAQIFNAIVRKAGLKNTWVTIAE